MADSFSDRGVGTSDPASNGAAVTPHDDNELSQVTRALYVGTTGDVAVTMKGGGNVTYPNVPVGWMPIRVTKVLSTGTTASDIVAVW